jgi:hypothetical protein
MRVIAFPFSSVLSKAELAYSGLGTPFKPCLSGPSGCPRECFSLIGTRLTGLLSWAPSIFIPENRPGLKNSLSG